MNQVTVRFQCVVIENRGALLEKVCGSIASSVHGVGWQVCRYLRSSRALCIVQILVIVCEDCSISRFNMEICQIPRLLSLLFLVVHQASRHTTNPVQYFSLIELLSV